ncbi:MAG: hypothetical protein FGF50_09705 [Candidatus Brockarchaeota archaeon]|nr:hypothetical protein [Candidatus Brockarchaeota archaeon]
MKRMSKEGHEKQGVEASAYDVILGKVENLEREVDKLKYLILFKSESSIKSRRISLRGVAKLLVPIDELEKSIEEAKSSTFRYELK